jgi:hypothetical protein
MDVFDGCPISIQLGAIRRSGHSVPGCSRTTRLPRIEELRHEYDTSSQWFIFFLSLFCIPFSCDFLFSLYATAAVVVVEAIGRPLIFIRLALACVYCYDDGALFYTLYNLHLSLSLRGERHHKEPTANGKKKKAPPLQQQHTPYSQQLRDQ